MENTLFIKNKKVQIASTIIFIILSSISLYHGGLESFFYFLVNFLSGLTAATLFNVYEINDKQGEYIEKRKGDITPAHLWFVLHPLMFFSIFATEILAVLVLLFYIPLSIPFILYKFGFRSNIKPKIEMEKIYSNDEIKKYEQWFSSNVVYYGIIALLSTAVFTMLANKIFEFLHSKTCALFTVYVESLTLAIPSMTLSAFFAIFPLLFFYNIFYPLKLEEFNTYQKSKENRENKTISKKSYILTYLLYIIPTIVILISYYLLFDSYVEFHDKKIILNKFWSLEEKHYSYKDIVIFKYHDNSLPQSDSPYYTLEFSDGYSTNFGDHESIFRLLTKEEAEFIKGKTSQ